MEKNDQLTSLIILLISNLRWVLSNTEISASITVKPRNVAPSVCDFDEETSAPGRDELSSIGALPSAHGCGQNKITYVYRTMPGRRLNGSDTTKFVNKLGYRSVKLQLAGTNVTVPCWIGTRQGTITDKLVRTGVLKPVKLNADGSVPFDEELDGGRPNRQPREAPPWPDDRAGDEDPGRLA